jgi:putative phosphoesterase
LTRIGIISDTHSYFDPKIIPFFSEVDMIWHAGDIGNINVLNQLKSIKRTIAVYGNIDDKNMDDDLELNQIFTCENIKVLITHIAGYPEKYSSRVKTILKEQKDIKLVVCGHSHIAKVMQDKQFNHLHINSGAAGREGFHIMRTIMRMCIDGDKISNLEIIELGKRGIINE